MNTILLPSKPESCYWACLIFGSHSQPQPKSRLGWLVEPLPLSELSHKPGCLCILIHEKACEIMNGEGMVQGWENKHRQPNEGVPVCADEWRWCWWKRGGLLNVRIRKLFPIRHSATQKVVNIKVNYIVQRNKREFIFDWNSTLRIILSSYFTVPGLNNT